MGHSVGDAGLELAEGPDREERAGLLADLNDVNECHLVIEAERTVAHAVGLGAVQLGVDRLDELDVGVGLVGLGPVADEAGGSPWRRCWTKPGRATTEHSVN